MLIGWAVMTAYPFLWILMGSFKNNIELYSSPMGFPPVLRFSNYTRAWAEADIGNYIFNSIVITFSSVLMGVFLALFTAYIVARFSSLWTKIVFSILTVSMMLPVILTLVPKFLIMRNIGLLNTRVGLILIYVASGIPFGVYLMQSFYRHLPREFEESAYLDGATPFVTFIRIILPISKPGMMIVGIFLFLRSWNEIYHALIMLTDPRKYTLPLGMVRLIEVQQYSMEWGLILAGVVIAIIPIVVFFIFSQRQIISGLTAGAIKG